MGLLLAAAYIGLACTNTGGGPGGSGGGAKGGTDGKAGATGAAGSSGGTGGKGSGGGAGTNSSGGTASTGGTPSTGGISSAGGSTSPGSSSVPDGGTGAIDAGGAEVAIATCPTDWLPAGANWAVKTADSIIANNPNPDNIASYNIFSWQVGYTLWSMEKIWRSTKNQKYFDWLKKFADNHVDATGKLSGFRGGWIDDHLPGYTLLAMYEETKEDRYKTATLPIRKSLAGYPRNSDGGFWHCQGCSHQMWIDGVYMGEMFLSRYGHDTGDTTAYDEVIKQMTLIVNHCQKPNGLILHGYDESKAAGWADKTTGCSTDVWSEGLGWYVILIADVFDWLPADNPGRATLLGIVRKIAAGLKEAQDQTTGRFCQVVDKCTQAGNWNESSGTGMFLYFLKTSIDKGYIDAATYCPVVQKAYQGLVQKASVSGTNVTIRDCSSISIQNSYQAYINSAKETNPPSCLSSLLAGAWSVEQPH
jgi:rhamnogalacturonyl hydrolase YesR